MPESRDHSCVPLFNSLLGTFTGGPSLVVLGFPCPDQYLSALATRYRSDGRLWSLVTVVFPSHPPPPTDLGGPECSREANASELSSLLLQEPAFISDTFAKDPISLLVSPYMCNSSLNKCVNCTCGSGSSFMYVAGQLWLNAGLSACFCGPVRYSVQVRGFRRL
jgi:hypothetical protein